MGRILRVVAIGRWLLSREHLPEIPEDAHGGGRRSRGFWGWIFGGSELEDRPSGGGSGDPSRGFLAWVASGEAMPTLPEGPLRGVPSIHRFWAAMFAGGNLDEAEIEEGTRVSRSGVGFLRWLLSPEVCPEDSAPSRPREADRLVWPPQTGAGDSGLASCRGDGFARWVLSAEECPEDPRPIVRSGTTFWRWLASSERL